MQSRLVQGIIHGTKIRGFPFCLTYILVGFVLGYKQVGVFPLQSLFLIPIFLSLFAIAAIINPLSDFESGVDQKETSNDRTMFDYGLKDYHIWNSVYFLTSCTIFLSIIAFWHLEFDAMLYSFFYIFIDIFCCLGYSLKPFRFKTRFMGGELATLIPYISIVNLSYFMITKHFLSLMDALFKYPALTLVNWTITANLFVDIEEDKKDNSFSSAIVLGESITAILLVAIPVFNYIFTIFSAYQNNNIFALLPLLTIPMNRDVLKLAFKKQKSCKSFQAIHSRQIQGIIHGTKIRGFPFCLSYILVAFVLGYKKVGVFPLETLFLIPIYLCVYCISTIINPLTDFESGVDQKETSNDRTMFDYGLKDYHIWNCLYFFVSCTIFLSIIAFWHLKLDAMLYCFLNIFIDIFFSLGYSLKPFRFKTKFMGGEMAILFGYISIFCISNFMITKQYLPILDPLVKYPAITFSSWLITTNLYVDVEDDKKDKSYSSAIVLGESITAILLVAIPVFNYIFTIFSAYQNNNIFALLPLLTIPMKFNVLKLAFKKQKSCKPLYFKSVMIYNLLFIVGHLFNDSK
ncbi:hypothetical protein CYY_007616 [Polysphondylium violaceum]|uniref:UbiA prenyltransferase family protein n=1 Tax=Polysphondylium violaceum TaxID=133409 RepID=A0A8J4PQ65_9MYCE|nr:hypothetical protein CYY_007616 [Polysphondylium violaceum]